MLRPRVRRPRREVAADGFTLIELVISIAILGIVMTAFASIISTSLLVSGETEQRLDASNALRRIGVTFTEDVASSTEIVKNAAGCTSGGTVLLELRGQTFDQPPLVTPAEDADRVLVTVTYEYADGTLTRVVCRGPAPKDGSTPAATSEVDSTDLATGLSAASGACTPDCANPNATISLVLTPSGGSAQKLSASRRAS